MRRASSYGTSPQRTVSTSSTLRLSHAGTTGSARGAGRLLAVLIGRPEGPLLELEAAARVVESDDPEVSVLAPLAIAPSFPVLRSGVENVHPGDPGVAVHRDDFA